MAKAMAELQLSWAKRGERLATFVVGTGDQVYHGADAAAFHALEHEVLERLPLPWVLCLGNHDMAGNWAGWHWHHSRHGRAAEAGWSWICPAPSYSLDAVRPGLAGPVDLVVINTNKFKGAFRTRPPAAGAYQHAEGGDASPFFQSDGPLWWREQKHALGQHLRDGGPPAGGGGRWRVVVGHHPCEYARQTDWKGWAEHQIPLLRYCTTTFMRGGLASQKDRRGLAHVVRRGADLYICGHQHLMAHMCLRETRQRRLEETRCQYAVVGCSSKTDQDEGDFDDGSIDRDRINAGSALPCSSTSRSLPVGSSKSYSHEWICADRLGFAVVDACAEEGRLRIVFYAVSKHGTGAEEVHGMTIPGRAGTAGATGDDGVL